MRRPLSLKCFLIMMFFFSLQADVVFSRKQLTFRPPLEDLRLKYYRQLKKFLVLFALLFNAFLHDAHRRMFLSHSRVPQIPLRCSKNCQNETPPVNFCCIVFSELLSCVGLLSVYESGEALFERLGGLLKKYEAWVGCQNICSL
jgi:hypothetical protein